MLSRWWVAGLLALGMLVPSALPPAAAARSSAGRGSAVRGAAGRAAAGHGSLARASAARGSLPRVPFGFVGMNVDQPVWPNPGVDFSHQLDVMAGAGVDSIRAVIDWSATQPYASWSQVPAGQRSQYVDVGGVPTDFTDIDALVGLAAQHDMQLLPVVMNAPAWDGLNFKGQVTAPRTPGPYAAFLRALVDRYGPRGSFWQENPQIPRRPVEMWQVWNEPNIWAFWPQAPAPWYRGYIALLRAAHAAIKRADPRAKVVLAGMPNYSWINLRELIRHGARNLFDVVDVHPYTLTPGGVITILGYARQVLDRYGRRGVPLLAGEISWPSTGAHWGWRASTTTTGRGLSATGRRRSTSPDCSATARAPSSSPPSRRT